MVDDVSSTSALGIPVPAETTALNAIHAIECDQGPRLSHTATLRVTLNSRAFAIATSTIEFASAGVRVRAPTTRLCFALILLERFSVGVAANSEPRDDIVKRSG